MATQGTALHLFPLVEAQSMLCLDWKGWRLKHGMRQGPIASFNMTLDIIFRAC